MERVGIEDLGRLGQFREVHRAPVFVARTEEFVPGSTYFQFQGERDDVWHHLARPADEIAMHCLQDRYGYHISRVMARPTWQFNDPPNDERLDPESRLVDGLLCGCMIEDHWWLPGFNRPRTDELINYIVVTPAGYIRLQYFRQVGESEAQLIVQAPMQRPDGYPYLECNFKANCPHWEEHIES